MKKALLLVLSSLIGGLNLHAQNWVNGGNTLSGNGTIGTNSNHALIFETKSTERGRITNTGLWGIGTPYPNSKFHINTIADQDPLRVMYNGSTKLFVHRSGGVAIGAAVTPPANGLHVSGKVSIGIVTPSVLSQMEVVNSTAGGMAIRATGSVGVFGRGTEHGLYGTGDNASGVYGKSINGNGIWGITQNGYGGIFHSENNHGIYASTLAGEYAGYFDGNIYTNGLYLGSDKNIKKDIQEIGNAMSLINQLKPRHYQFRDDGKYASLKLPKGNHYGLLAQDVEQILPNLVKESSHEVREHKPTPLKPNEERLLAEATSSKDQKEKISFKAVNYTELIPIVIKGMQEQQQTIQELKQTNQEQAVQIEELKQLVSQLTYTTGSLKPTNSYMSQSLPNPTYKKARINLTIPANSTNASLLIHNMAGQQVMQIPLDKSGSIEIDTSNFSSGTYSYSLYLDGKFMESRKLMVVK